MKPESSQHDSPAQELIARYVYSVKSMLPPDQSADIAAEIRSNLQSLVEDRAADLGRDLTREEVSALLKQFGHPVLVANRYHTEPRRGLISPQLFPFYWFTLRAGFGGWVAIRVMIAAFQFEGTATAAAVLTRLGADIVRAAFIFATGVTLLFALWEHLEFKYRYSQRWKPESLPPVPPAVRPPQPRPAFQIMGGITWLIFWAAALFVPAMSWVWGGRGVFSVSDAVYAMRLPLWLLAFFGISQSWLNYTRFATAEWRPFLRIGLYIAGTVVAISMLRAGDLLVEGPKWIPSQAKPLATLNQMLGGVLLLACIFAVLLCVQELRRVTKKSGPRLGSDHQTAGSAS